MPETGHAAADRFAAGLLDEADEAVLAIDGSSRVVYWNTAAEHRYGCSSADAVGRTVCELVGSSEEIAKAEAILAGLARDGGWSAHYRVARGDGTTFPVHVTDEPVFGHPGRLTAVIGVTMDLTRRHGPAGAGAAARSRNGSSARGRPEPATGPAGSAEAPARPAPTGSPAPHAAMLGTLEVDLATRMVTGSEEHDRIIGIDPRRALSVDEWMDIVHPDDRPALLELDEDLRRGRPSYDLMFRILRHGTEERHLRAHGHTERDEQGRPVKLFGIVVDDTERVEADRVRRRAETRFDVCFEQAGIGAAITDLAGTPTRVNAAACTLLGRRADEIVGHPLADCTYAEDPPLHEVAFPALVSGADSYADERRFVRPDGTIVWASTNVALVRDEAGQPDFFCAQFQNITDRKKMEWELIHRTLHDPLTGLPNRTLLTDRLHHSLAVARRSGLDVGVLFLDIDHFKEVNDTLGHACGDDLLRHAADRITRAVRPGDTVARYGGDEFVVVCDAVSAGDLRQIAARVLDALRLPFEIADPLVHVGASIGVVIADEAATPDSLLRDADAAMYRAKARGRGRAEIFDQAMRAANERRTAAVGALRGACERQEFTLHYQPIIDLTTGALASAEALVRWERPGGRLVAPREFIPLAEESGLIVSLGSWVLEQACRQLVEWRRLDPALSVVVNLSPRQLLSPEILPLVADALGRTGAPAEGICLEVTERVFLEDAEDFGKKLDGLKALGVQLSIDDFGTRYSSLNHLKRYPFDAVKVGRTFIKGLGSDRHDSGLVAAVVLLATVLDLEVTAEGVETRHQLEDLQRMGCPRAQGYHFAPPMPAAQMDALVARPGAWPVPPHAMESAATS